MRKLLLLSALLLPSTCLAQAYAPANDRFSLERWDEDYSFLKDPSARQDLFDPIKYIPLNQAGDAYLSLGGEARYRYNYFNNRSFGPGINDEDGFHFQRYLLHLDAHLTPNIRAFVQLDSAFVDGRTSGARYGDADNIDLQQAFVDIKTSDDADPFAYLRLGRQELAYGAQRLISPDDWRNVRRSFDGAKISLSIPHDTLDFFLTRPVFIEKDQFDNDDNGAVFAGIYNVLALPQLLPDAHSKLETYLLALNQTQRASLFHADADTYTAGVRFFTHPGPFDFDVEGDYQFGDFQGSNLSAWSLATEMGYTLPIEFTPRPSVGLDLASGSPSGDGRFNQLFPPTHMYLGNAFLFGRPNVLDLHSGVDFHLTRSVNLYTAEHIFWRQNTSDGLYDLLGNSVRAAGTSAASFVGNEFDIAVTWQINPHLTACGGWAHFFSGDFLQRTGASDDVDFLYASASFTF